MRTILLEMTICGFKCIDKPTTIQFTNKIPAEDAFDKAIVKAIYGTNGEGKSAIVHAMDIYRRTVIDDDYLTVESSKGALSEIINKKSKKASVALRFHCFYEKTNTSKRTDIVFKHVINYFVADKDGKVYIESEELSMNPTPLSDYQSYADIFKTSNGEIIYLNKGVFGCFIETIKKGAMNLVDKKSFLNCAISSMPFENFKDKEKKEFAERILVILFSALSLSFSTSVYLDEKDSHTLSVDKIKEYSKMMQKNDPSSNKPLNDFNTIAIDNETDKIDERNLEEYEKQIKRITKFIKVFKPELKEIKVDYDPIGDKKLICKKIFIYEDGNKVSSEYESSGIKKLMKLFPILNILERGGIAFIDEFDSNIHDVYLCKLIEYVVFYTKGQLVFTTHNLGPMEILDKTNLKHTIDFINQSVITSWKKNGNYSIVNVYRGGAIPNCPFNIDASDFAKVFGES